MLPYNQDHDLLLRYRTGTRRPGGRTAVPMVWYARVEYRGSNTPDNVRDLRGIGLLNLRVLARRLVLKSVARVVLG